MFAGPTCVGDFSLCNSLAEFSRLQYWDGQPAWAISCHNSVAVTPVSLRELHLVIQNKGIRPTQQVKISAPGDIIRLQYYDCSHARSKKFEGKGLSGMNNSYYALIKMPVSTPTKLGGRRKD
jgi:hypothetical protein